MMMEILIVEDDLRIAEILKQIVEIDQLHRVACISSDLRSALAAIEHYHPQLALIDLHLAQHTSGIEVAAKARERNVPSLFTTASPLPFPVPEIAIGCLSKPYTCYSVGQSLRIAEQIIGGVPNAEDVPKELELY